MLVLALAPALSPSGSVATAAATHHSWSIMATPNPAGTVTAALSGITCPSVRSCFAVGNASTDPTGAVVQGAVEHRNGNSWSLMSVPAPAHSSGSALNDIACPGLRSCFAVGDKSTASNLYGLVVRWDGTRWRTVPSASVAGATGTVLNGVACPAATSCFAVGYHSAGSAVSGLVEHWNGTTWATMVSRDPAHSTGTVLEEISCASSSSCFAVGYRTTISATETLVERWNGKMWSVMTTPNSPGSVFNVLNGVWCASGVSCFAVGYHATSSLDKALIEHWNGHQWAVMANPGIPDTRSTALNGVTCPSTDSCFAVGYRVNRSTSATLIEHWNGHQWAVMPSPNPPTATGATLSDVSCPRLTSCFAVGDRSHGARTATFVERYS